MKTKAKLGRGFIDHYQMLSNTYEENKKSYLRAQKLLVKAKTLADSGKAINLLVGSAEAYLLANKRITSMIVAAEDTFGLEWSEIEKENGL